MTAKSQQMFLLNPSSEQAPSTSQKLVHTTGTPQVNIENVENFSNVCRICATVTEFVIPIFAGEGLQNNLSDKIHKHLPIQVLQQDGLPHVVCFQCASTLLAWHELVKCCVQADAALRSRLSALAVIDQRSNVQTELNIKKETLENKFKEITALVERRDPPRYVDTSAGPRAPRHVICNYCAVEFLESSFKQHLIAVHAESLFQCDDCDTYVDRKDFITHMSHHALQYANISKNELKKKIKLKKENNEVDQKKQEDSDAQTPPQTKKADHVDNIQKNSNEFSDHSDTEDGFGPLPESVFEAIEDSQDSQANEKESSPLTPDSQTFPTPPGSETSKPATGRDKIKPHKKTRTCPVCSKVYTASSSFFYHMKHYHKKSKDHECDVCGKKYATKANLVQHGYTHGAACQYECKTCSKRFKCKASLYIHEQIHSGVKRHACTECHRAFRWKTHLVRHMKRHSHVKAHACPSCGRGFAVRGDLLRHARTHSAGSFTCTKCNLKFAQQRYLKVHMRKKHSTITS